MFSFNSIKGKWTGKWEMLYIFIGTDLWLIYIFQGWEMGNVPIPGFYIYYPYYAHHYYSGIYGQA